MTGISGSWLAAAAMLALAGPAMAEDLRPFCTSRPGLGEPPCIVDRGYVVAELGLGDWTRETEDATRTKTFLSGDGLLRFGVDRVSEVQLGWSAYGRTREIDRAAGSRERTSGVGDVTLGYRRSLMNPSGSKLSIAVQPSVTLPTGGQAIGQGSWSADLAVMGKKSIGGGLSLELMPSISASANESRHGRHLAYGAIAGVGIEARKNLTFTTEISAIRDRDPSGHSTELLLGEAIAWQPGKNWQLDVGGAAGLNHASLDRRIYFGVARRF
ncbi:transporter [Sphingomonas naphthae]|uniref:Transporter n=1 Tax=Sphingomonas naphthae TaxID=1813468 RepID=A0ABY7TKG8_9SPHN|nr:transporter [Sphingomonas naphthae]WCT72369.1 transporter [Sphingomonas naphthae]